MDTLPLFALNDNPSEKECTKCMVVYLATTDFFPPEKNGKNGLSSRCRVCHRAYRKNYREKPDVHEKCLAQTNAWRSRPEIKKRVREYNRAYEERPGVKERRAEQENTEERKSHKKAYFSRPEVRERMRLYYGHPDRIGRRREYGREYGHRPENKERFRIHGMEYRSTTEFQEHKKEWRKEYNQRPAIRARNHEYRHDRRARKRLATGTHTYEQVRQQYDRQKGKCYYCQINVSCNRYHVDHVVPLSRGGSNDISNLVIACPKCNLSKYNKLPHEFFNGGRLL